MMPHVFPSFPKEVVNIFRDIQKIFENIPQEEVFIRKSKAGYDRVISCHMICRTLANLFPVECRDGYFVSKMNPHSWLVPKARWSIEPYFFERYIIDPYPWLVANGPIMVYNFIHSPWQKIYLSHDLPDVRNPDILCDEDIAKVTGIVRKTMENLGMEILNREYLSQCFVSKKDIDYKRNREGRCQT